MSRVRILNLPSDITAPMLKKHFLQHVPGTGTQAPSTGVTITDCHIARNAQGAVRMAFLGFKTAVAAAYAKRAFNGSFLGARRIVVEPASGLNEVGPEEAARRQMLEKKHQAQSVQGERQRAALREKTLGVKRPRQEEEREKEEAGEAEPTVVDAKKQRREAFVEERVQQGSQAPTWARELALPAGVAIGDAEDGGTQHAEPQARTLTAAEAESIAAARQRELGAVTDLDFLSSLQQQPEKLPAALPGERKVESRPTQSKDQQRERPSDEPESDQRESADKGALRESHKGGALLDLARTTRRVRVTNIPYTATEEEIKNFFSSQVGPVAEVHLPLTRDTKQSKGAAFVRFVSPDDALKALNHTGKICMGRLITVEAARESATAARLPAQNPLEVEPSPTEFKGVTRARERLSAYQQKKEQERQKQETRDGGAGAGAAGLNSLYVSQATAVDSVAHRLGLRAEDVVNVSAPGAAVRAAVAEAVLTDEATKVLRDEGIDFGLLSGSATLHRNRSNNTILVKNLPAGASLSELVALFRKAGTLDSVAAPSDNAFALFSFVHPQDARAAFQRLAYKKYGGQPLFLEWAPIGCVKGSSTVDAGTTEPTHPTASAAAGDGEVEEGLNAAAATHTAYVTNLPFQAKEDDVRAFLFDAVPKLKHKNALVSLHYLPAKGQAFVTVTDEGTFQLLLSRLPGRTMEGRIVAAAPAQKKNKRKEEGQAEGAEDGVAACPPGCDPKKVVVKNLPFEATENDLRELFAAFTEVKAIRVPRKIHNFSAHRTNNHRGFGFVEFLTEQEARNALRSLSNTHLYGRHLVLQYAAADAKGNMAGEGPA